ncbi:MAG: winged helix-turn-helix domain-containing protein [Pedosphaera parvula]|nr:winged helix-turn-helix domain-containing protein [Pedosphaera parvula]
MLRREQGIELSKSAVSRLLAQMGLSPQRPLYQSYKQRPKELKRFLEQTFPGLRAQARRTGAVIFFVDEAAVRSDAHRGTTWGKVGQTPVVRDSGDRFGRPCCRPRLQLNREQLHFKSICFSATLRLCVQPEGNPIRTRRVWPILRPRVVPAKAG